MSHVGLTNQPLPIPLNGLPICSFFIYSNCPRELYIQLSLYVSGNIQQSNRKVMQWGYFIGYYLIPYQQLQHIFPRKLGQYSVQLSSVQSLSRVRLCDPMNRSTPGLPVHHQLPEFIQTHVHRVGDAIQTSHPLSSPSPPAPNPSQHQGLFQ